MSNHREVPQFINIEDKIAFQLTAKQLGWIALGAFFAFLAWVFLDEVYFIINSVIITGIVLCFLFIRPYGQTLYTFLQNAFFFLFKPKVYIWRKGYQNMKKEETQQEQKKKRVHEGVKRINKDEIKEAIKDLDIYE